MALHYLIDGYNVIHQMPECDSLKLETQRLKLVQFIENHRPQGSVKNKVTIVFDGQGGHLQSSISSMVETIFSVGESADEKIKSIVEDSKNPKNIIIVTDDRDIQIAVRKSGASIMPVAEFLLKLKRKSDGKGSIKGNGGRATQKNISHTDEYNINIELSKIWLKKK
jgi:predicted RNA-binding protein with PIN domain